MQTPQGFEIDFVYFANVPPYDDVKKHKHKDFTYHLIEAQDDELTAYLFKIFDDAPTDCKVEILFTSNDKQENEIRSLILKIAMSKTEKPKEDAANDLSMKMYEVTDGRNETGLFIIMQGRKGTSTRVVLARFKRNEGLRNQGGDLEYIKNVFTKSKHYKLAIFEDVPSDKSFWKGYAIDRQSTAQTYKPFSIFWIEDFLQAQTALTSVQGTDQLSKIVKQLLKQTTSLEQQEQIISAVVNLRSKPNAQVSMKSFCQTYLTPELTAIVQKEVNDDFFNSVFDVNKEVMNKELGATVLTLDEGITAYVPTFKYGKHVTEEVKNGKKTVTIQGVLKEKRVNTGKEPVSAEAKPKKAKKNK